MANRNKPLSYQALTAERASAALVRHPDWHKWAPARQIDYLFTVTPEELRAVVQYDSALWQLHHHCVALRTVAERVRMRPFLLALASKRTELLHRPDMAPALGAIGANYRHWRRELAAWAPKTKNVHAQLESLIRHLFDQYGDVPAWVLGGWGTTPPPHHVDLTQLAIHLGSGQALRSFDKLPVPLTKRLEHEMRQAPAHCTFQEAYRHAQLAIRDALDWFGVVLESRLGRQLLGADDDFWLGVFDFFRATPMADSRQFGPVCDWIHQKRAVGFGPEPPQPGFSLKGRTLAGMLDQMTAWHHRLAQNRRDMPGRPAGARAPAARRYESHEVPLSTAWPGLAVPDFKSDVKGRARITQLTTYGQLVEEGRTHQHCVASYLDSCRRGRCGIFSLAMEGQSVITLEVTSEHQLVQARGRHNRPMTAGERHWVNRWLAEARLAIGKYV
ncbi:MAG: PcfJ domain-containing protein [Janthinobacterium lividum]